MKLILCMVMVFFLTIVSLPAKEPRLTLEKI